LETLIEPCSESIQHVFGGKCEINSLWYKMLIVFLGSQSPLLTLFHFMLVLNRNLLA